MHNYPLSLKVEGSAGSDIADFFDHALRIASHMGIVVCFDFNGVHCGVRPNDAKEPRSRDWFLANYHKNIQGNEGGPRFCYANP